MKNLEIEGNIRKELGYIGVIDVWIAGQYDHNMQIIISVYKDIVTDVMLADFNRLATSYKLVLKGIMARNGKIEIFLT